MNVECPICKCVTEWIPLEYEHCEIGFADCSPYLSKAKLVSCKGCGLVRVDGYPCQENLQ